jgi:hypothetical protein
MTRKRDHELQPSPDIPPALDLAHFFDQDTKAEKMRKACYDLLLRHYATSC